MALEGKRLSHCHDARSFGGNTWRFKDSKKSTGVDWGSNLVWPPHQVSSTTRAVAVYMPLARLPFDSFPQLDLQSSMYGN